jgi:hypothetical protein
MVSGVRLNTGVKVSGVAHMALILWMIFGGVFSFGRREPLTFTEVSVMTTAEFAAMMAARSVAPDVSGDLAVPDVPDAGAAPAVPRLDVAPNTSIRPRPSEAAQPEPTTPDAAAPLDLSRAEVEQDAPTAPAQPDVPEGSAVVLAPDRPPTPRDAPRVAPLPADRPAPEAVTDTEVREAVRPDESLASLAPVDPEIATAPEEATTNIVTEATQSPGGQVIGRAPAGSPRPRTRPSRPVPAPEPAVESAPDAPSEDAIAAAVAAAVAEAQEQAPQTPGTGTAPTGPPLTAAEQDALRLAVQACWVVDVGSEAAAVTVTVAMRMQEDGRVVPDSLRMIDNSPGSESAVSTAYAAARRAILRCQRDGYPLPPEKFAQWREIEMVFNPERMRIR